MHELQFSCQSSKFPHADVMVNVCNISKHLESNFQKSEFNSCIAVEKLGESICALGHLEIVEMDVFTCSLLYTLLHGSVEGHRDT